MTRLIVSVALVALAATPAAAQLPQSDINFPGFGSSAIVGGFHGPAFRDIDASLFRSYRDRVVFRSPEIAAAVSARGGAELEQLRAGTLQVPEEWRETVRITPEAQQALAALLTDRAPTSPAAARVLAALRGGRPGTAGDEAERLVGALAGLLTTEREAIDTRGRWVAGEAWQGAFKAYKEYLRTAPDGALDPVAPELATIAVFLRRGAESGIEAGRR